MLLNVVITFCLFVICCSSHADPGLCQTELCFPTKKAWISKSVVSGSSVCSFSWLHYGEEHDSVLCFTAQSKTLLENCILQLKRIKNLSPLGFATGKMHSENSRNKDSDCHKMSIGYAIEIPKS